MSDVGYFGFAQHVFRIEAGHHGTDVLSVCSVARDDVHKFSFINRRDPVAEDKNLVQVFREKQDAGAHLFGFDQLVAHKLGGADVQALCGQIDNDEARAAREHAGQDHFLQVAAGQGLGQGVRTGSDDVKLLDEVACELADTAVIDSAAVIKFAIKVVVHGRVLHQGEVRDGAHVNAVGGDVAHAQLPAAEYRGMGNVLPFERDFAGLRFAQAGQCLYQLGLAVSGDAGHAEDLTFADGKGDTVERHEALVVARRQIFYFQDRFAGLHQDAVYAKDDITADQFLGETLLSGVFRRHAGDDLAFAQHGYFVADAQDDGQFVSDEGDNG